MSHKAIMFKLLDQLTDNDVKSAILTFYNIHMSATLTMTSGNVYYNQKPQSGCRNNPDIHGSVDVGGVDRQSGTASHRPRPSPPATHLMFLTNVNVMIQIL